ncbi:S8 family serine peptidase [Streptomyces sp. NPDC006372]|uniref:S8 family serine peptidase n=1 Tax=Streptomyces sp. NPDC006372 TaxID=3155599 RepID=UPI0033B82242
MSHDQPDHRRTAGRRPAVLVLAVPVLAGSIALATVSPAQGGTLDGLNTGRTTGGSHADHVANPETQQHHYPAGTYLVQLADEPVAAYTGGTEGLRATKPVQGRRLDVGSRTVDAYQDHLREQRDDVLAEVPGVKPLYTYDIVANGFAARLTAAQANRLARTPGVASLSRNETIPLARTAESGDTSASAAHTTATATAARTLPVPDVAAFLGLKSEKGLYSKFPGGQRNAGAGTILGVLDTGIDTHNPSLRALPEPRPDAGIIAKKWKGECDPGEDTAHQVRCNNKVIGAQYFDKGLTHPTEGDWKSPMDADSHGTHTATTAAGDMDVEATVPDTGLSGRISGLAPAARIAAYKVCWSNGCSTIDLVAAIEKAVADGVDVINYSLGGPRVLNGPTETAMLNATKAGVFISAAAGNDGPDTVSNQLPWITTVAASTHDTGYRTTVTLGDGNSYTGAGISASAVGSAPLVDAAHAARSGSTAADAELCLSGTLDPEKVKGAIVLCKRGISGRTDKSAEVKQAGGVSMVLANASASDEENADAHSVPTVHLSSTDGQAVKSYVERAGAGATARLSAAEAVHQRAPMVGGFSSSGPDTISGGDLLKPDITAPGVDIVAGTAKGSPGFKGAQGLMTGTSMSTPHLAGLALLLRALHPDWSPAEIKSALMTTATTTDNTGKPIQRAGGTTATPLDYGAGQPVVTAAADPGLVYDSTSADWTSYICAIEGRLVDDHGTDACATATKTDPSDLNYPTIAVGDLVGHQTVTRTVTNVSATTGVYTAKVKAPGGFKATVSPRKLVVVPGASATYKVTFTREGAAYGDWSFGSVTWADTGARHTVRSAVALRAARFSAPAEATGSSTGSLTLHPRAGWNGTLTARVTSLYAGETKTGTLTGTNPEFDPDNAPADLPPATISTEIHVPDTTRFARVAILPAEHLDKSDLDLWVVDKDSGEVVSTPRAGNNEHVDLKPGTYTAYVNQLALPEDIRSQTYTLHTWLIGDDVQPDRPAAIAPASQPVTVGDTPTVTVSWPDRSREASNAYLGLVEYGDATVAVGRTALTVMVAP